METGSTHLNSRENRDPAKQRLRKGWTLEQTHWTYFYVCECLAGMCMCTGVPGAAPASCARGQEGRSC